MTECHANGGRLYFFVVFIFLFIISIKSYSFSCFWALSYIYGWCFLLAQQGITFTLTKINLMASLRRKLIYKLLIFTRNSSAGVSIQNNYSSFRTLKRQMIYIYAVRRIRVLCRMRTF